MFKNIVRNLPFSPSLVDQVGFYIKRLRQEEFIRRLGMIFTALAVSMQMLSFINPPTYAQTANDNNVVYEAVTSKAHMLQVWNQGDSVGHRDIDDLFRYYSIARSDVEATTLMTMSSNDKFDGYEVYSVGRIAYAKPDESAIIVPTNEGPTSTFYIRPWARSWGIHDTQVLRGTTAAGKEFAIIMNCGNLAIALQTPPPQPQPVTGDFSADCENVSGWAYDPRVPTLQLTVIIKVDNVKAATITADQSNSNAPAGSHGFSWAIPESYLDNVRHNVSVVARENVAARGISEGNQILTSSSGKDYIPRSCNPLVKVCNLETNQIITVLTSEAESNPNYVDPGQCGQIQICREGQGVIYIQRNEFNLSTDYLDVTRCSTIQVCIDDQMVSIPLYDYTDQPTQCPTIQVCRDGVVIPITTDKRLPTDLAPEDCDELQVCDVNGSIITILRQDYDPQKHSTPSVDSFGQITCEEPNPFFVRSKLVRNLTTGLDNANGTTAHPGDELEYQLTTANTGNKDGVFTDFVEDLTDVLEYAELTDNGGGSFNSTTNVLSWNPTEIKAGDSVIYIFKVRIDNPLDEQPQNPASLASYDLKMTNVYGNGVEVNLPKTPGKQVETWVSTLPNTGPTENAFFMGLFVILVAFFYFRNRLVIKELQIIRSDYNGV